MARGTLPSYVRMSHIPNILEAYRYSTRRNLTVLSSELKMSYHTVRRLCIEYSTPRYTTMDSLTAALPFINQDAWVLWKSLCDTANKAETRGDVVLLNQAEDKLRALITQNTDITPPIHLLHECSIAAATKLHGATVTNRTFSYYLSDLHNQAMDLLSIKRCVTKSELLRLLIDEALVSHPDVLEALVRSTTGIIVEVAENAPIVDTDVQDSDYLEITTEEELRELVPHIATEEVVAQVTAVLPLSIEEDIGAAEDPETIELLSEPVDFTTEDGRIEIEEWSPAAPMDSNSNLTEDDIAKLFSGED
jgi:hypothetical protein